MYPILLNSPFKENMPSNGKIYDIYKTESLKNASEIWLLSSDSEGESTAQNGELKGKTISEIAEICGKRFFGKKYDQTKAFPLFIRLIDAKDNLPLCVSDKDRLLIVKEAENGANMILGFSHNVSEDELRRRVETNTLFSSLNMIPLSSGDIIRIPAGYLYAVGKGVLCFEISEGDTANYTISDYGRVYENGRRTKLQTEAAIKSAVCTAAQNITRPEDTFLYPFGTVSEARLGNKKISLVRLSGSMGLSEEDSFTSLIISEGSVMMSYPSGSIHLKCGDSILVPASTKIKMSGYATIICSSL
ncbi:MAG: hypothetical protein IJJ40_04785 [Clostridia bacterium]|nr:hypothetical protein [Clostridia bacterium]